MPSDGLQILYIKPDNVMQKTSRTYWWDFAFVLADPTAGSPVIFTATATTGPPRRRRLAELAPFSVEQRHNARLQVFGGTLDSLCCVRRASVQCPRVPLSFWDVYKNTASLTAYVLAMTRSEQVALL